MPVKIKNTGIDNNAKFKNSEANVSVIRPTIADKRQMLKAPTMQLKKLKSTPFTDKTNPTEQMVPIMARDTILDIKYWWVFTGDTNNAFNTPCLISV